MPSLITVNKTTFTQILKLLLDTSAARLTTAFFRGPHRNSQLMASDNEKKFQLLSSANDISERAKFLIKENNALVEKLKNIVSIIKQEQSKKQQPRDDDKLDQVD